MSGQVQRLVRPGGAVVEFVLEHVGRLNAISRTMWWQLQQHARALQGDEQVQAVLVRGAGDAFAAGADIGEFPEFRFDERTLRDYHEGLLAPTLAALQACDVPLVAQITGACVGGGLEIAACCDIRIADESAIFGVPIAKLGFPMAPDELAALLRATDRGTVAELLLEARMLDAATAQERGLVQRVVPREALSREVEATLERICALPREVARRNKRTLRQLQRGGLSAAERGEHFSYADTPAHRQGIAAFLGVRSP
jgi:enoyl-CoA hydratase/carnithine racemase